MTLYNDEDRFNLDSFVGSSHAPTTYHQRNAVMRLVQELRDEGKPLGAYSTSIDFEADVSFVVAYLPEYTAPKQRNWKSMLKLLGEVSSLLNPAELTIVAYAILVEIKGFSEPSPEIVDVRQLDFIDVQEWEATLAAYPVDNEGNLIVSAEKRDLDDLAEVLDHWGLPIGFRCEDQPCWATCAGDCS